MSEKTIREVVMAMLHGKLREKPYLTTTKGNYAWANVDRPLSAGGLEERSGGHDTDTEACAWVEYWDGGECVHRSVHVHLKQPTASAEGVAENF